MLYANNNVLNSKPTKLLHYSTHMWRLLFLINTNHVYNNLLKKFFNGSTAIPLMLVGYEVFIYSGVKWLARVVSKWSVGTKIGALSWNRKRALFKSKQLKKK